MNLKHLLFTIVACSGLFMSSCMKDDDFGLPTGAALDRPEYAWNAGRAVISTAGSENVTFSVSVNAEWCSLSPDGGQSFRYNLTAGDNVVLYLNNNYTSSARVAKITVRFTDGNSVALSLLQHSANPESEGEPDDDPDDGGDDDPNDPDDPDDPNDPEEQPTQSRIVITDVSATYADDLVRFSARFDNPAGESVREAWFVCTPVAARSFAYAGPFTRAQETVRIKADVGSGVLSAVVNPLDYDLTGDFVVTVEMTVTISGKEFSVNSADTGKSDLLTVEPEEEPEGPGVDDPAYGDPTTAGTYNSFWPELPVEVKNSDYHYAHHICPDFSVGGHKARNYTVCFSAEHHCPLWVAAPRHKCYEGDANRSEAYKRDPNIQSDIQYSSKDIGGGCNKGHMLGSAERTVTKSVNQQVFYYSNIAPQYSSNFNTGGGGWNMLEDWVDGKVCADTTYVVIGAHFDRYTDKRGYSASPKKIEFGGRYDVSCPTMFYYLVLRTKKGNTGKSVIECSSDELMCAAFVRTHSTDFPKSTKISSQDMMSVADLEQLTGFTFFANVPNAPKDTYNPSDWGL